MKWSILRWFKSRAQGQPNESSYETERRAAKLYANTHGYYWMPCPLCGEHFGGHESKREYKIRKPGDRDGQTIGQLMNAKRYESICPRCGEKRVAEARALIESIKDRPQVVALHREYIEPEPGCWQGYGYDVYDVAAWLFEAWMSDELKVVGRIVELDIVTLRARGFVHFRASVPLDDEWPEVIEAN